MSSLVIKNGRVITPGGVINGDVLVSGSRIEAVGGSYSADTIVDAAGSYVSPGFVDIHTHGGGGCDFLDATPEAFLTAARFHAQHGSTTILPTLTSADAQGLLSAVDVFERSHHSFKDCAHMPGLHLEGPYFSPQQCGAQDPRRIHAFDEKEYTRVFDSSEHILRWSAAPELPGAARFAEVCRSRGIRLSIAHSNATYEQVLRAYDQGFTHITHLYSGMSSVFRISAVRFAGVVESAYLIDGMTVEIIADGVHLPESLLRFVCKFKDHQQIALVTDSMRGAGMPDGESILGGLDGGLRVIIEDGVAKLPDRSSFAGSVATADRLVRTMVRLAGLSIPEAVRMVTENPSRIMGFSSKGRLAPGFDADIILFDDDIRLSHTILQGTPIL